MRTTLVLIGTLLAYFSIENLIFNTNWYPKIVSPDSSTGLVELELWNEEKRPVADRHQVLAIGDSRMGFFPRYPNAMKSELGYTFASIATPGATPRDWYYMLRAVDPTRRRYAAIVIPVEDYEDAETVEDHADRETDLHYLIARLRWSDIPEFAGSYHSRERQWKTALGILLKGWVYKADFQDLIAHLHARLAYADLARRESTGWYYGYAGPKNNMTGIQIDWKAKTFQTPPGLPQSIKDGLAARLFDPRPPFTGQHSAYLKLWFGRIYDLYRGSGTRIVFFRLPRGGYFRPDPPPDNPHSSVRRLARRPGVILDDEHYFDSLERPELFLDERHLNGPGEAAFSKMLGRHIRELLGPPED